MAIITPGLEKRLKWFKREWTPATSVPTDKGCGPDKVVVRGKPSDHKALEVVVKLDIVEKIQYRQVETL